MGQFAASNYTMRYQMLVLNLTEMRHVYGWQDPKKGTKAASMTTDTY
eukprot:NODE_11724_length_183_cov_9.014925_g11641_i0.p4 GENE.NODE_11724_length_183_cov_9.014925_g11641_i0~~NODE_11724_length_183_cov_9.014925_g11641_i0.p4  ORF type:complete len:54 (+),score=16.29 NODE_11724_length_183_cov_9.014925_g11641_i0:22-162(+)